MAGPIGVVLGVAALAAANPTSVIQQGTPPDTNAITPELVAAGRKSFHGRGSCFACHGTNLEGGPIAPTLKSHEWKDAKGGDLATLYYVITHGVKGTAMVAHPGGIRDDEAARIAAYIWSVNHRGATP
jgi:mono/diheme cytochrome c family protein